MTPPLFNRIESLQVPAAIVDYNGKLLTANKTGKPMLESLIETSYGFPLYLSEGQAFQRVLGNGIMLKGTPLEDDAGMLLEWQEMSEAEARLALFQAVAKSVNSSLILEEIFDALGEVLRTFIPFEGGTIVILDESQNSTKVVVFLDEEGQAEIRGDNNIFIGYDSLIDDLVRTTQSKILSKPFSQSVLAQPSASQALLVPLISKGMVIGCIGLSGEQYTTSQLQLLEDVSEQLAVAVENARLYWQTQSQAGREFLINQITKAIRQSLDIEQILQTTVQEVGKVMGLSRCLIHYWGQESEQIEHFEYVFPGIPTITKPDPFATMERTLFSNRTNSPQQYNPFILNDSRSYASESDLLEEEGVKSLAVFPILLEETVFVGTISLHQCDTYRAWLGEEIELLKAIAEHVSVALHQANLFQEKENQRKQLETTLMELQQTQMHLIQSEKMAVLGQFVAGIAHEVNTPLGTLMANDNTVMRCLEQIPIEDEKAAKYKTSALALLKINQMASERIQEIVRNLRNFARLDESDLKLVNLHEGLDTTLLLMESSLQKKIRIVKNYGDLPLVECFPGLLNQIFMNLLVNASHSIEAEGAITIQTAYKPGQNEVEIAISDTGKGIAPEHIPRIFDPGFTTKGVGVGTGLGLALCYKIMDKHHGHIAVKSTVGVGTTMTVILPVRQSSIKQGE